MLWSPFELAGLDGGGGTGSLGTGVELRLPAHGLMESTAEAQVDLSASFLSPGAMLLALLLALALALVPVLSVLVLLLGWVLLLAIVSAREAPREDQLLDETCFACLLTTSLKVVTGGPRNDANLEVQNSRCQSRRNVHTGCWAIC